MADPVRYFFDEHVDPRVAAGLLARGIDVLTVRDAGRVGLPDPDQLAFAAAAGRVLVTFDADYLALHASSVPHAGLVWIPSHKNVIGYQIDALKILHGVLTADDMLNHLEYL